MATILIVDDRPTNRELAVTLLRYAGHRLLEASEGEEGLAIARSERPDLIITDIVMPTMDGYEFARRVRADPSISNTQIIFHTSSYIVEETRQLAKACGVSMVLSKPVEPEKFLEKVGEALDAQPVPIVEPTSEDFHLAHMRLLTDTLAKKVDQLETEVAERKRAEEALQASEGLFRSAFQYSPVGMCITTLDGRLQTVNQALGDMVGFTMDELEGKHFNDITHSEDLEIGEDVVARMSAGEVQSVSFEKRYLHKTGEPIWAHVSSTLLRESSGSPIHFISQILNITERKRAEEQARAQTARLKVLADASQAFATAVQDYQGMLEMVARQTAEAMGGGCGVRLLSEDGEWLEMVAMHDVDAEVLEFVRRLASQPLPADEPNVVKRVLQSLQPLLMPGVSEDQLRPVVRPEDWVHLKYIASQSRVLAPIRTWSQALGILVISRKVGSPAFDEQDLKLAQDLADRAALAISNARLFQQLQNELAERERANQQLAYQAHLLENVNDAIVVADANYVLQAWNQAAEKMYGWAASDVIGKNGVQILQTQFSAGDADETRRQVAEAGYFFGEATQSRKDGQRIAVEIATTVLRDVAGQNTAYVSVVRDITKRKEAEAALRESQTRLSGIIESAMDAIITIDEEQHITLFNPAAEQIFQYSAADVIGQPLERLIPDRFRVIHTEHVRIFGEADITTRTMRTLGVLSGLRANGEEFPIEASISHLEAAGQKFYTVILRDISERKRAEAAALESEARYHRVLDAMMEGCQIIDFDWRYVYVNDVVATQGKYTRQELLNHTMMEMYPGIEHTELFGVLRQCMEERTPRRMENEFTYMDGSLGWFELSIQPAREGIFILSTDITERKRSEGVLRQSEERFASIFRSSPTPIALTRLADGKTMDVNEAFCQLFGFTREEAVGHTSLELGIVDPEAQSKRVQRVKETGMIRSMEVSARDRHGKPLELLISIETMSLKDETYALTTMIDITESKQSEERNRFLANLVANASDAIIAVDMQQNIQSWNNSAESLYGWKEQEVLGRPSKDILDTDFIGITREAVTKQIIEQGAWSGEALQLHRDGTRIPVQSSVALYKDSEGRRAGIVAVNRDITERKRAEAALQAKSEEVRNMSQQLWQAAKLATMGELAASIAHELNNPLATVSLRAEMLQMQFTPEDAQSKSLQVIDSEIKRMSRLVANLLQFSRRSSSQISTIKVNEEVAGTLELIQYHLLKNSIQTVQELSPDLPLIQADRQQLRQVFLNLFTNAADAMPLGGILTIRTWSGERPESGSTAPLQRSTTKPLGLPVSDAPHVFIEVSDTGEGISLEKLERVWEPFYTTKPEGKGTGLGLAICRRIIQEHGGTIELMSEGIPGKGTTVQLSLPALKERD